MLFIDNKEALESLESVKFTENAHCYSWKCAKLL